MHTLIRVLAIVFLTKTVVGVTAGQASTAPDTGFSLRSECPPGFELTVDNRCKLRSLYQFYGSTQNRGVGGTHTGLPPFRDGFSPQQIDLGRYLFFDPLLSSDGSQSCASCHQPEHAFSDGKPVSIGVNGKPTQRSTPTLWNSGFLTRLFWDGRATSLEQQAAGPLFSELEMSNTPENLLRSLRANEHYRNLFAEAFGEHTEPAINLQNVTTALTAFQTSLVSLNSRYDQYAHGHHKALSEQEIAGMNVFRSFVARCSECHTPPLFTNNQIAVIGTPEPEGHALDVGAEVPFGSSKLKGGFKVPTLRNIEFTAPYMHSGVFTTLRDATEFYNKGRGHAVPDGVEMQIHWHITEPDLSEAEIDLLVAFMKTLNDQRFMPTVPQRVPSGLTPKTKSQTRQLTRVDATNGDSQ